MRPFVFLSATSALLFPVVGSSEVQCKANGFSCMGYSNNDTDFEFLLRAVAWVSSSGLLSPSVPLWMRDATVPA